ncbi:MAG: DUF2099 family protein [Kiritimatiellia bacterium]
MNPAGLVKKYSHLDDLHITRVLGCWAAVSDGRVLEVDRSSALDSCPLQQKLSTAGVAEYLEEKIRKFGHFTASRGITRDSIAVPYGTSEMLMYALRKDVIDCAVTVCDGAGTVVTDRADVVQGIGARMNGLFHTTPVPAVQEHLRELGCLLFEDAAIDQARGLSAAAEAGYGRVAATVNLCRGEKLEVLRALEREKRLELTLAGICSTGVDAERAVESAKHTDLAWACASEAMRCAGGKALLQLTLGIPVFVYSKRGLKLLSAYSDARGSGILRSLDTRRQYLLAGGREASGYHAGRGRGGTGREIQLGRGRLILEEAVLPVRGRREPCPLR